MYFRKGYEDKCDLIESVDEGWSVFGSEFRKGRREGGGFVVASQDEFEEVGVLQFILRCIILLDVGVNA